MPVQYIDRATYLTGDAMSTVAQTGVACRFAHVPGGTSSAADRAELAAMRRLLIDPSAPLPSEHMRVRDEATGVEWHVVPGTIAAFRLRGQVHHRSCDLVRVEEPE